MMSEIERNTHRDSAVSPGQISASLRLELGLKGFGQGGLFLRMVATRGQVPCTVGSATDSPTGPTQRPTDLIGTAC